MALLSMTGHGQAVEQFNGTTIEVEVRSVNNRFLKVTSRLSGPLASLESHLESLVREVIRRGSVQVAIRLSGTASDADHRLNFSVIEAYVRQIQDAAQRLSLDNTIRLGDLLQLPGVIDEAGIYRDNEELLEKAKQTLHRGLLALNAMRSQEGEAMATSLLESIEELRERAGIIAERAPRVIDEYRNRLHTRVEKALEQINAELAPDVILREVQIFADRCDIREELIRLESHFKLFREACEDSTSQGRKLDFLVQELNREINTVGSKANDAAITEQVVAMKTVLEQIREIVQNIE